MKTDEELRKIAMDIGEGRIFSDRHLRSSNDIKSVFMVLNLMDKDTLEKFLKDEPAFIYEYLDKASERMCNGMPSFLSLQYLNKVETKRMLELFNEYKKTKESFLKAIFPEVKAKEVSNESK